MEPNIEFYVLFLNVCILLISSSSSSCVSSYDDTYDVEEDERCRNCSDTITMLCTMYLYYAKWNKQYKEWVEQAKSMGDDEAKIIELEVINGILHITIEVPVKTRAVLMTFSSVLDTLYKDDFYSENKRYRVFDLWSNKQDVFDRVINQRDHTNYCEFSGLNDGLYRIRVSLQRFGDSGDIYVAKSADFMIIDGVITMQAIDDRDKDDTGPQVVYAVIGALLGVVLLMVLACVAWTKRKQGRGHNTREQVSLVSSSTLNDVIQANRNPNLSSSTKSNDSGSVQCDVNKDDRNGNVPSSTTRTFGNDNRTSFTSNVEVHIPPRDSYIAEDASPDHVMYRRHTDYETGRECPHCGLKVVDTALNEIESMTSSDRNIREHLMRINFEGGNSSLSTLESLHEGIPLNRICCCQHIRSPCNIDCN
ncbi:hypothetical protein FSP39_016163 [Pinctada imbricata]|uniref:Uncharacterized protein n=1 Tax=Pinctada imbricata TaxID=66713 RepID=A0AA88YJV8_PINIB|nr:hypothetical protein FSP39_016163 [Pinctada imbricata]